MRILRRHLLAFALLTGSPSAWANEAHHTQAHDAGRLRFKSPFKKGLPAITTGPLVTLGGKAHVDANAYKDISAATQHLLSLYPADKHFFVGIGRDGAPIIAFLQNLGGKQMAVNFPASSNNGGRANATVLAEYVKKIIPEDVLTSGRTIVFIDATTSGRALDFYVPLIAPSLRGAPYIKAPFGVPFQGSRNYAIFTNPGDKKVIETAQFPEVNKFFTDPYEEVVGEFPRHGPGIDSITVLDHPLPQFQQFRDALMQRMERDEGLHHFLKSHGGAAFKIEEAE